MQMVCLFVVSSNQQAKNQLTDSFSQTFIFLSCYKSLIIAYVNVDFGCGFLNEYAIGDLISFHSVGRYLHADDCNRFSFRDGFHVIFCFVFFLKGLLLSFICTVMTAMEGLECCLLRAVIGFFTVFFDKCFGISSICFVIEYW